MAHITCGNCKATHGSASEVRKCYGNSGRFNTTVELPAPSPAALTTPRWAKANMDTNWSEEARKDNLRGAETKGTPHVPEGARQVRVARGRVLWTTVPDGRYAIEEADGTVKFYKVNHGKEDGRWAGWVFVDAMASDELWAIKNADRKVAILAAIGNDIAGAMALYGREIGKCGHCGRKLTSEWRKRGIGPICAQKMGW